MGLRGWLASGAVIVSLGALLGAGGLAVMGRAGPLPHAGDFVVPRGSSAAVARALVQDGVVRSAWVFRVAAAVTGWQGPMRAGELSFPARADLWRVLAVLREGRVVEHRLTIPEGLTAWRIGQVLSHAGVLAGAVTLPDEGGILPDTYAYVWGMSADAVLARGRRAMDAAVAQLWRERAAGLPLRSERELVVLASLVERETHLAQERPLVARVFLNRLGLGMRLQSDPTVAYGESGGLGEVKAGLTREALARATPYNTYAVAGLPAGPICAPGLAALQAVAHPARSGALYFVADGTGGHVFADTLEEHARNVARYRSLVR